MRSALASLLGCVLTLSSAHARAQAAPSAAPSPGPAAPSAAPSGGLVAPWSIEVAPAPPPAPTGPSVPSVPPVPPAAPGSVQVPEGAIAFVSDDTPVDVFLVTGTREVLRTIQVAPPMTMPLGTSSAMFAPPGVFMGSSPYLYGSPFVQDQTMQVRATIEQRRFLCRTPCTARLPLGTQRVHLRTLDTPLGTESVEVTPELQHLRARPSSVGWYAVGQALAWTGAAVLVTGSALLVQGQLGGCTGSGCPSLAAVLTIVAGVGAIGLGIPLVVMYQRRLVPDTTAAVRIAVTPVGIVGVF